MYSASIVCSFTLYSVDEMKLLLSDDDKLQKMLASRVDEVNDVQQKVVLFIEKFASELVIVNSLISNCKIAVTIIKANILVVLHCLTNLFWSKNNCVTPYIMK